jgi:hypothetical protein
MPAYETVNRIAYRSFLHRFGLDSHHIFVFQVEPNARKSVKVRRGETRGLKVSDHVMPCLATVSAFIIRQF